MQVLFKSKQKRVFCEVHGKSDLNFSFFVTLCLIMPRSFYSAIYAAGGIMPFVLFDAAGMNLRALGQASTTTVASSLRGDSNVVLESL